MQNVFVSFGKKTKIQSSSSPECDNLLLNWCQLLLMLKVDAPSAQHPSMLEVFDVGTC